MIADKDWAMGRTLLYFSKKFKTSPEETAKHTIAIGDGAADFMFSTPLIEEKNINIPFIFVGPESQFKPTKRQKNNLIIKNIPPKTGVEVVIDSLNYLDERVKKFI